MDLILALYPLVVDAVIYCKKVRSGEIIYELLEDVRAEKVIFCGWIQQICVTESSGADINDIVNPKSAAFSLLGEERLSEHFVGFARSRSYHVHRQYIKRHTCRVAARSPGAGEADP